MLQNDLHKNGLPFGTVRRSPGDGGFAHAILVDQGEDERTWEVIDLWGSFEMSTEDDVADWPIVYQPVSGAQWARKTSPKVGVIE